MSEAIGALPIALFPPVHWWVEALRAHIYVDDQRTYHKQTLRNRYTLLSANGRLNLTVPVQSFGGMPTPMRDIRMGAGKWKSEHLHAIRSAYGRSAYFEHYYPLLVDIFHQDQEELVVFCRRSLGLLLPQLTKKGLHIAFECPFGTTPDEELSRDLGRRLEPNYEGIHETGYPQAFSDRFAFESNLSYIDLIMNKGPQAIDYILFIKNAMYPQG